jgi:hypothetical protein
MASTLALRETHRLAATSQESDFHRTRPGARLAVPIGCCSPFSVAMNSEERAEFIAALTKTADMVELLLRQIDLLTLAHESERQLTDTELRQLHEHQTMWRSDLERLRQRLASVTIEPPTRVQ